MDYLNRFVAASLSAPTTSTIAAAVPQLEPSVTDPATSTFIEADMATPPAPLSFRPHCAYVRNMVVARHTADGKGRSYRIDAATCGISNALGDTGAGLSIVGSRLLQSLPKDACVEHVSRKGTADLTLHGAGGEPLVTRGTVTLLFTLSGRAFRHSFIVVEGGDLLLLGNDFIALCNMTDLGV